MSSRSFKRMPFKKYTGNGARRHATRAAMVAARRPGMYTVPRTMGAVAVTERKYFDSFLNGSALTASTDWTGTEHDPATLNCLFVPVEGSDINERIGRKVTVRKIQVRGHISIPAQTNQTTADQPGDCRIILYQDLQTNASFAQGEQLMAAPGAATALLCNSTFQSTANFGRFRVLKDKVYSLRQAAMAYDGTNIEQEGFTIPFKFTIRFRKPVVVRFNATNGGTVADIVDNSFHIVSQCTNVSLAPVMSYQCRVVYTDA